MPSKISRRGFFSAPALFSGLQAAQRKGRAAVVAGYGELRQAGEMLLLPPGFQYSVISYEGDAMADGFPVPSAMDGMACFPLPNGNVALIRNHEIGEAGRVFRPRPANSTSTTAGILAHLLDTSYGPRQFSYDTYSGGGTTTIEVDPRTRRKVREYWSLVGTLRNCAGGPTPWGSWLTCEETLESASAAEYAQNHGYVFEVPADTAPGAPVQPVPLRRLGRFSHEAVAVDPATGIIYETEDQGNVSGFYRYVPAAKPAKPGDLAGDNGRLQMLRVNSANQYVTCIDQKQGIALPVGWVDVPDPDPASVSATVNGETASVVFRQGLNNGGAIFRRGEGCWYWQGKIYFTCTNGGEVGLGQIWVYDIAASTLTLVFETPDLHVLDFPDNMAISPRGGIVVCEDGSGGQFLRGVTPAGDIFDFARNIYNTAEMAGACFSPDGQTMFVNIYGRATIRTASRYGTIPLIPIGSEVREKAFTLAIWGPWGTGLL
ncbi:MAG: DUF839 domain-containing protein [Acidobacteria bacterium]|nr:DUF839 domain-containing protein [Acidobacteriota bacterium]